MSEQNSGAQAASDREQIHAAGKKESVGFFQTMMSVIAAGFGVQSSKNKERDFEKGSFKTFVIAALIFTAAFVLTLVTVVRLVLP